MWRRDVKRSRPQAVTRSSMCSELLVDVRESARRLGLGRSLTYRLIQTGALRSVKIGGARRILVSDLEDFVQRLKEATNEAL